MMLTAYSDRKRKKAVNSLKWGIITGTVLRHQDWLLELVTSIAKYHHEQRKAAGTSLVLLITWDFLSDKIYEINHYPLLYKTYTSLTDMYTLKIEWYVISSNPNSTFKAIYICPILLT